MHRDVKPMNIIVDKESKTLRLLDWGLSEYYLPDKEYNVRVASRPFKGPELLIGFQKYDYSLDIWSTGCIFAAMIFKKEHVFLGRDNLEQLIKITNVLGTQDLYKYMEKYNVRLEPNEYASIGTKAKKEWSSFINNENCHLCSPEALDLLNRMLIYDHVRFNPFNNKIFRLRELLRNKLWPINSLTQSDTWYNKSLRQQVS
jgi:casein kinase II subunit alpha